MRRVGRSIVACLVVSLAACHAAAPPIVATMPDPHAIDSLFAAYDRPDAPGASLIVLRDGRPALVRTYGLADLETRTATSDRTNYRLASLTKQFTATAILLLVQDGRLHLDDRATDLLPELPPYARDVRVRHLLGHTSGLWDYEDFVPDSQTTQVHDRDVPALIRRADSTYFPPGSAYRYSNTGYALLALIVERVSGMPFARFLHDRIFVPVGMDSSVAYEQGISTVPHRAYGYSARDGGFVRTDQSNTSAVLGDGGIYSSVHDLAAWDRALDAHTLLTAANQALAWATPTLANGARSPYGFGWFVDPEPSGLRLRHHGETMGFTNGIVKLPSSHLTVIVLTNRTGGEPWTLAERVAELFGAPKPAVPFTP